jgi:Transcriptional regulators of sugar metabolism
MLKNDRHDKIIDILQKGNSIKISELAEMLGSSMMTIRRDLDKLEELGTVKRFHGGVSLARSENSQPSFYERIASSGEEKRAIGAEAAKLVMPGAAVFFDAGTTPLAVLDFIPDDLPFTAITPGLLTAVKLCSKPMVNVYVIGGTVHKNSFSSTDYTAVEALKRFHADLAFISARSVVLPDGLYEVQMPLIEIKRTAVDASDKVVLLADSSKFKIKSMCKVCSMCDIDSVITDEGIDTEYVRIMDENNIKYKIATK